MYCSVKDLKDFYDSDIGKAVRATLGRHIAQAWPDVRGMRVMGCGYALPYIEGFCKQSPERVIAMMPIGQGVQYWPSEKKNLTFCCEEYGLPIESASVDRVILTHYLEGASDICGSISEVWRVLKANGRALIIVPNRIGVWARAEWSPFGHGRPFTMTQLSNLLQHSSFEQVSHKGALFMPPIDGSPVILRSAKLFEKMGGTILPFVAGVHIVEVRKRVYASVDRTGGGSAVLAKTKEFLGAKKKPAPQGFNPKMKK